MSFGLEQIKELRGRTGAGIMDCKEALKESEGDVDGACEVLRKKGLAKAAKKSGRAATEGLVAGIVSGDGKKAAMVEVNCETDFVARTDQFQAFLKELSKHVLESSPADIEALKTSQLGGKSVQEKLTDLVARLGENMALGRFAVLSLEGPGQVGHYVHAGNKIGVLAAVEAENDEISANPVFQQVVKDVCLQVCASVPECLTREEVPADLLDTERRVLKEQALSTGKPEKIVEKIVEGRLKKYYKQIVLLEQVFIKDTDIIVDRYLAQKVSELGGKISIKGFARIAVGEA